MRFNIKGLVLVALALSPAIMATDSLPADTTVPDSEVVPGQFIVVLNPGSQTYTGDGDQMTVNTASPSSLRRRDDTNTTTTLQIVNQITVGSLAGVVANASAGVTAQDIANDPNVYLCEPNIIFKINQLIQEVVSTIGTTSQFNGTLGAGDVCAISTDPATCLPLGDAVQRGAASGTPSIWGLPRISERQSGASPDYFYPYTAGQGVDIYILDSGVNRTNPDLAGRVTYGTSFIPNEVGDWDNQGHGTYMASLAAGTIYGVAKQANIISVKVAAADGSVLLSDMISAVNWVAQRIAAKQMVGRSVINMSIYGAPLSTALDTAITAAAVPVIVASGNAFLNSCLFTPSASPNAFAVGAVDNFDYASDYNNYGSCVRLYAPGNRLPAINRDGVQMYITGTSPASAMTAGVAALYLASDSLTRDQLYLQLIARATVGMVDSPMPYTPNLIVYNDIFH